MRIRRGFIFFAMTVDGLGSIPGTSTPSDDKQGQIHIFCETYLIMQICWEVFRHLGKDLC